jgi:hypothetical protein
MAAAATAAGAATQVTFKKIVTLGTISRERTFDVLQSTQGLGEQATLLTHATPLRRSAAFACLFGTLPVTAGRAMIAPLRRFQKFTNKRFYTRRPLLLF